MSELSRTPTPPTPSYLTWEEGDSKGKTLAIQQMDRAIARSTPAFRSAASSVYLNIAPNNVSVRDEFSRGDYENFRRGEALPVRPKDIIRESMRAYQKYGIVRNIIDLMADFTVQGIDLVHPVERIEKFYKEWFRRVRGRSRSERFANILYRAANVIVKREIAYLPLGVSREMSEAATSPPIPTNPLPSVSPSPTIEVVKEPRPSRREIPWRYSFFNPLTVELADDELATFLGEDGFVFTITLSPTLIRKIRYPRGREEELVNRLPTDIIKAVRDGQRTLVLDSEKVSAFYYKKDDWQSWAEPMLFPILVDLKIIEKMKLADVAALDGAMSNIRVWKLGNLDAKMLPSETIIMQLAEMLNNNVGGGVMDLVWGPAIELIETNTDIHRFLGSSKYEQPMSFIYQGLGIPSTLTGSGGGDKGFTNNFISLKTLIERLEYGRSVLCEFWEKEIRLVQKAMGFNKPANLVFDRMTLNDESAEKQLLLNLADRDMVSWEYVMERFGATPEIEMVRLRRESRKRGKSMPVKAGPFHEDADISLRKIFSQSGAYAPSEMGVELLPRKANEESPNDLQPPKAVTPDIKGQPGEGRPKLARDSKKRKQKRQTPRQSVKRKKGKASDFVQNLLVAENMLGKIAQEVNPIYLKSLGKKTMRELTEKESEGLEDAKFVILCKHTPEQEITTDSIKEALHPPTLPLFAKKLFEKTLEDYKRKTSQSPPLEVRRRFQAAVYTLFTSYS